RGDRAVPRGARQLVDALPAAGVGDLVVVLDERDEPVAGEVERRLPAAAAVPPVLLPLVKEPVLRGGHQLARGAEVVGEVALVLAGDGDPGGVVEVVVPEGVEPAAAAVGRADEVAVL